ncbi:Sphingomyelin phosphodiesterase [Entomophthora muscae]|uniref:Sphingomyelin phosphodiesterase n=1 Tax=Entomophthora muscae TaxID=34485 RepID=A0ACC2S5N1_9FUNG|nr:Sphingomyelin phosphodiesterase [Entomophthora muscae]
MKIVVGLLIGLHAFSSNDILLRGEAFIEKLDAFYQRSLNPFAVFQTPNPSEYEDLFFEFTSFVNSTSRVIAEGGFTGCASCKNSLSTIKSAARFSFLKPVIFEAAYEVCRIRGIPREVCRGALHLYAPWFLKVLEDTDLKSKTQKFLPQLLCFSLDNTCEYPEEIVPDTLVFPPHKQVSVPKKERSNSKHLRILHLSDLHIDHKYTPGSEADCGLPICCRTIKISDIKRPANVWGDYNCDLAPSMLKSMLDYIKTLPPLDLVIFTGDIPAHDVWNQTVATSTAIETATFKLLKSVFSPMNIPVIPAIGNHETVPANNFSVGLGNHYAISFDSDYLLQGYRYTQHLQR